MNLVKMYGIKGILYDSLQLPCRDFFNLIFVVVGIVIEFLVLLLNFLLQVGQIESEARRQEVKWNWDTDVKSTENQKKCYKKETSPKCLLITASGQRTKTWCSTYHREK